MIQPTLTHFFERYPREVVLSELGWEDIPPLEVNGTIERSIQKSLDALPPAEQLEEMASLYMELKKESIDTVHLHVVLVIAIMEVYGAKLGSALLTSYQKIVSDFRKDFDKCKVMKERAEAEAKRLLEELEKKTQEAQKEAEGQSVVKKEYSPIIGSEAEKQNQ